LSKDKTSFSLYLQDLGIQVKEPTQIKTWSFVQMFCLLLSYIADKGGLKFKKAGSSPRGVEISTMLGTGKGLETVRIQGTR
jgi:hypothetical protein